MDLNATIVGQSISFILFIWFCMKYIWPNIINIIENRKKEISVALLKIEQSKQDVKSAKKNAINIINQSKKTACFILQEAHKKKIIILEQSILLAQKEKKRIILQAQHEIHIQKEKVKNELMKHVSYLAIKIARKIIRGTIQENDDYDHLIKKLVVEL